MSSLPPDPLEPVAPRPWRSLDERAETPAARAAAQNEFLPGVVADAPPAQLSRRTFLGLVGATAALATSTACDWGGNGKVVPYTKRPQEVVPGVANYYASTFPEGRRAYSVLVKTREGRPIHITGNDEHPGLLGKTSPRALADLPRLYDPDRLRQPGDHGRPVAWDAALGRLHRILAEAGRNGRGALLLAGASASPGRRQLLAELKRALPALEVAEWEPGAGDGAQEGARAAFGGPVEARPRLDRADLILSLGADVLNGEDPGAVRAFAARRRPARAEAGSMNRLWVFEGPLTLTGTRADQRYPVRPSRLAALAFALARDLHEREGLPLPAGASLAGLPADVPARAGIPAEAWRALVKDLRAAGPRAVVLCGEALPAEAHVAAHLLNAMLGSHALDLRPAEPLATLGDLAGILRRMAEGRFQAAVLWGVNPAYAYPDAGAWAAAFAKVRDRAWIGLVPDESAAQCDLLLPEHHWLEAWGDHQDGGWLTLQQPALGPLYDTRQGEDMLLAVLGRLGTAVPADYHAYLQARWGREERPAGSPKSPERFFQEALHDGLLKAERPAPPVPAFRGPAVAPALQAAVRAAPAGLDLVLRPGTQVYDGRYANNGWLQELPDPVTKVTWGNPLSVAVADAQRLGLQDGDLADLAAGGRQVRVPVVVQPGQAEGVLALALGYGGAAGAVAKGIGVNAFPFLVPGPGPNLRRDAALAKGRGRVDLAMTQNHHRMEGRELVRAYDLEEYRRVLAHPKAEPDLATLYPDQVFPEHKWGMAIDLSSCVGCGACVLACQSENNVATVGPAQVIRGREMHWLRIDRYYEGAAENPRVHHQPMLCQHCDAAPCENVCPVNATNHSPDGLNQMVYNRCVGTRYCSNNCPYKVRRFNFLEYTAFKQEPEDLVYNPEVTVRPRGVMEKCTFCVQRIQDGRMRAKAAHRPVRDGEIVPACAAACPAEAIVFGDLKDPKSRVAQLAKAQRGYKVLEELGARPAITYLADLRNPALPGGSLEP